jgi:hypothetical protein
MAAELVDSRQLGRIPRLAVHATAIVLFYSATVCWFTWPLARHLTTHLPKCLDDMATYDPLYMATVLAHESRALVTAPSHFTDPGFFYPSPHVLFYGDTGFGALPYFMPTFLGTGNPTLALNLLFLGCSALTAASFHLVVRRWTGSHLAGFIAAWTYVTTPWVLWSIVPTAPSYAVEQYFPFIVFLAAEPDPGWWPALALVPLIALQCLTDLVYVASAVLAPLGLLALVRLGRHSTRTAGLRLLTVLAVAVLLLSPAYMGHLAVRAANPNLAEQSLYRVPDPPDLLPWDLFTRGPSEVAPVAWVLIGLGGASLFLRAIRREERLHCAGWRASAFWAIAGLVISVLPQLGYSVPLDRLPRFLSGALTTLHTVRVPSRLRIAALIGLALLAGLAFAECASWLEKAQLPNAAKAIPPAALAGVFAVVAYQAYSLRPRPHAFASYCLNEAVSPDSAFLSVLGAPGGPLLELPIGAKLPAGTAACHARAMYRAIYHGRPVLNGYSSYWPRGFPERMRLAMQLPAHDALIALRRETGLEMILVHSNDLNRHQRMTWHQVARGGGNDDLHFVAQNDHDWLFSVTVPDGPR